MILYNVTYCKEKRTFFVRLSDTEYLTSTDVSGRFLLHLNRKALSKN
jgi:hypothetical protein